MGKINRSSFLKFLLVGALATVVHYLIMIALIFNTSLTATTASAVGFAFSTILNYIANAHFTFQRKWVHKRCAPRFLITALIGLAINQAVLILGLHSSIQLAISQILATLVVVMWSYTVNAVWTFSNKGAKLC